MARKTIVILTPNLVKTVDDIQKFTTSVSPQRIMELIKQEEAHMTSEEVIGNIKMHRFYRSEIWQEKSNATRADSNGK